MTETTHTRHTPPLHMEGSMTNPSGPACLEHEGATVQFEFVTPELASLWLQLNVENRPLRAVYVGDLVRDMVNGRFHFNGDAVRFGIIDVNGENKEILYDGQHRLTAIVKSGVGQWLLVVRGIAWVAHRTIDIGKARTLGHQLQFENKVNATHLAAALGVIWAYENGVLHARGGKRINPTKPEMMEILDRWPDVEQSVSYVVSNRRGLLFSAGSVSGIHHLIVRNSLGNTQLANDFVDALRNDEGLTSGDPILAARRWYLNTGGPHKHRADYCAILIKTFNAWARGDEVKLARWGRGSENYPVLHVPASRMEQDETAA